MIEFLVGFAAWLSQGVNQFIPGPYRHHDLTVSARAWILRDTPTWGRVYRGMNRGFFWQEDHCRGSFEADVRFAAIVAGIERHERRMQTDFRVTIERMERDGWAVVDRHPFVLRRGTETVRVGDETEAFG